VLSLLVPILRIEIPSFDLSSLLLFAAPRHLDVVQFVIWVKHCDYCQN
jgi:hypothetical protein